MAASLEFAAPCASPDYAAQSGARSSAESAPGRIFSGSSPGRTRPGLTRRARLRAEGLIAGRRNGKSVHYRLASEEARWIMLLLYELFCEPTPPRRGKAARPFEVAAE